MDLVRPLTSGLSRPLVGVRGGPALPRYASIAGLGNSITAGTGASSAANRWLNLVGAHVGAGTILNAGIAGTVLQNSFDSGGAPRVNNMRDRYVADVLGANLKDAIFTEPLFNDARYTGAPTTFALSYAINDLREVVTGLIAGGYAAADIYLLSPIYITDTGLATGSAGFTGQTRVNFEAHVEAVRAIAVEFQTKYADLYTYMRDHGGAALISEDEIHPNDAGHAAIAACVRLATIPTQTYTAETEALVARFTTPPTVTRKVFMNNLIETLIAEAVWGNLDTLWLIAGAEEQTGQRNWKADAFNLNVAVAPPTFTADRGYAGNGTTQFISTDFAPSVAGGVYTLNSAHLSLWSRTEVASGTQIAAGARTTSTTNQDVLIPRNGSNQVNFRLNQGAAGPLPASATSIGHFLMRRSSAAATAAFRNGVSLGTGTDASTGMPTATIMLGALNTGGTIGNFATHQIAAASLGASLTDTQVLAFYEALRKYLYAVGAA